MFEQALHVGRRRQWHERGRGHVLAAARAMHLVAHQLHRHGEVERGVDRVGRDAHQQLGERQFVVGQPRAFIAEQQRHGAADGLLDHTDGRIAHVEHAEVLVPFARGGGGDQPAVADRLEQVLRDAGVLEHVDGPRGPCGRLGIRKGPGPDQVQFGEAHVLHGAGNGPDVPGVGSLEQDDADIGGCLRVHAGTERRLAGRVVF